MSVLFEKIILNIEHLLFLLLYQLLVVLLFNSLLLLFVFLRIKQTIRIIGQAPLHFDGRVCERLICFGLANAHEGTVFHIA